MPLSDNLLNVRALRRSLGLLQVIANKKTGEK